jgi:hypothetical protein
LWLRASAAYLALPRDRGAAEAWVIWRQTGLNQKRQKQIIDIRSQMKGRQGGRGKHEKPVDNQVT